MSRKDREGFLERQVRRGIAKAIEDDRWGERGDRAGEAAGAGIERAWRFCHRYRYQLAPFAAGLAVLLLGTVAHAKWPVWATALGTVVAVVGVVIVARRKLDRDMDRAYALDSMVAAGLWVSVAAWWHPTATPMLIALAVIVAVFGMPWWANHRIRRAIKIEKEVELWHRDILPRVGMGGARLYNVKPLDHGYGFAGRIKYANGRTFANFVAAIIQIESLRGLREGAIQAEPDRQSRDSGYVRVVTVDPHAEPIPWHSPSLDTATDPIGVGLYDDATEQQLVMFGPHGARHLLVGGIQGSGKSGLINRLLVEYVPLDDVVLLLIDLKGGQELGAYRPVAHAVATTPAAAERMLRGTDSMIDRRGETADEKTWNITPDSPAVLVVIDEAARLTDNAQKILESTTQRGRSTGVGHIIATQYPTTGAITGQVKSQCNVRACFAMMESRHGNSVLSKLRKGDGVDVAEIPGDRPGTCYMETPDEPPRPALLRVSHVEDSIDRVVEDSAPTPLDEASADAFAAEFGDSPAGSGDTFRDSVPDAADTVPDTTVEADSTTDSEDSDGLAPIPAGIPMSALAVDDPDRPVKPKLSKTEAERVFDETLTAAGPDGTSPKALCDVTGYSRQWVNNRLSEVGAERVDHGIYRVATREEVTV